MLELAKIELEKSLKKKESRVISTQKTWWDQIKDNVKNTKFDIDLENEIKNDKI